MENLYNAAPPDDARQRQRDPKLFVPSPNWGNETLVAQNGLDDSRGDHADAVLTRICPIDNVDVRIDYTALDHTPEFCRVGVFQGYQF